MTVFDGPQATQLTRCHPGSLSHPVFLFLAQPHDDVQVPHCSLNRRVKRERLFYGKRPFPWEFDNLLD